MKNRLEWLDIAKGIGILLVVLSHCLNIGEEAFQLIFTFHMPMFFALSGYVFNENEPFNILVKKKAKTLLLPFALFFLLGLIVTLVIPEWKVGFTLSGLKQDLWLANPNSVHNSSIWYLVCLFFVVLLFHVISKLPAWLQFLCLLICYAVGIQYSKAPFAFMGYGRLPLNLDVLPVAVVFFALGYYAKVCNTIQILTASIWREIIAGVASGIGVYYIWKQNGYVNLHGLSFGSAELYLLGGCLGTLAIVGISSLISRVRGSVVKHVLIWYGRHSLTILGLQSLLIRLYIVVMSNVFGIQLGLYQFPIKHTVLSTILVAFVVCPLVCILEDLLKKVRKESVN